MNFGLYFNLGWEHITDPGGYDHILFIIAMCAIYKLSDFRKMAKAKSVSANTVVFNNLVNTKAEYLENWEVPAKESWHNRFLA